jgi:hypothetical protein
MPQAATQEEKIDLAGMVADLNGLLRLKTTVIGMNMFARAEDMAAIRRSAAGRYKPLFLGVERSVDCALGRDHCRWFVVGLTRVFYGRVQ